MVEGNSIRAAAIRTDVLDLRNKAISQLSIAGGIPIGRFDLLSRWSEAEGNNWRHAQRRCRSSALS